MNLIVYFSKKLTAISGDTQKHSITTVFLCLLLLLMPLCSDAQVSQIQGPRNSSQMYSGVVYGPIDNSDTLWGIASRYKQGSQFSVYQTMYAIYELNPQAFENGNFNKMVSGAILQLPSDSYISRIDPNIAREKALNDERRASTRNPNQSPQSQSAPTSNQNKPVSKDELSDAQKQLQEELNTIRLEQQQQFDLLKEQVSDSIKSVQILIQENKQLYEQLKSIDENNRTLTESVENQLQQQIDEQMTQLSEIVALVKAAEEQKRKQEEESIFSFLASPIAIIVIMSVVTIALLAGLALLLLKRTAPVNQESKPVEKVQDSSGDIVDDDLVIGEVDDSVDKDSDELLATLSESLNDDDILSDELASDEALENLDDDLLTDELDSLDDMLVPDSPYVDDTNDDGDLELGNEIEDLTDGEVNTPKETVTEQVAAKEEAEEETPELEKPKNENNNAAPQNELAQSNSGAESSDGTPDGIELNDNGEIDDTTLNQIEEQIEQKDNTINELADDIIAKLDAGEPGSDEDGDDSSDLDEIDLLIQESNSEQNGAIEEEGLDSNQQNSEPIAAQEEKEIKGSQDLSENNVENNIDGDDVAVDLTSPELNLDETDSDLDQLSEDLLDELTDQDNDSQELDDLLDSLSEFEEDNSSNPQESVEDEQIRQVEDTDENDLLSNDLLEELESSEESESSEELVSSNEANDSSIDEDDFLNDIPSFTSDLSDDADPKKQAEKEELGTDETVSEKTPKTENKKENSDTSKDTADLGNKEPAQAQKELEPESVSETEEDVLSSLPDLDNWVDEPSVPSNLDNSSEGADDELDLSALELDVDDLDLSDTEFASELSNEEDILNELDDNDFDDMLNELSNEDSEETSGQKKTSAEKDSSPLDEAGLDIEQLTSEDSIENEEYLDVDDLIKESESSKALTDDDLVLDLEKSLGNLAFGADTADEDEISNNEPDKSNDQSGNLDLAQVYIDMEDVEAASELLEQVIKDGSPEERKEAKTLLASIAS